MSICTNCGHLLDDDDSFCSKCGAPVHATVPPPLPHYQSQCNPPLPPRTDSRPRNAEPDPLPSNGQRANLGVVLLIVLVLAAAGLVAYLFTQEDPAQGAAGSQEIIGITDSVVSQVDDEEGGASNVEEQVSDGMPSIGRADNPTASPFDNSRSDQPGPMAKIQETAKATAEERDEPAEAPRQSRVAEAPQRARVAEAREAQPQVYKSVEQMPTFPGGDAALMRYISSRLQYPANAQDSRIQGTVVVQFVVTNTGRVGEAKVVRSVDRDLDREAIRVCRSLPNFVPGRQNGQPVNVWYTLPVKFKLQ